MESNGMVILPEIILAFGGLLIFCIGAFGRNGTGQRLFIPALVFLGAGLLAGWLPARRATRVDTVEVLTAE